MRIYTPLKVLKVTPHVSKAGKQYTRIFGKAEIRCDQADEGIVEQVMNLTVFGKDAERAAKIKPGSGITIAGQLSYWKPDSEYLWSVAVEELIAVRPFKKRDSEWTPKKVHDDSFGDDDIPFGGAA